MQVVEYAQGMVDNTGQVTLTFDEPRAGQEWDGTVSVPVANANSSWQAFIGTSTQAAQSWNGSSTGGPFNVKAGQSLTLTGQALTPGLTVTAVFTGLDNLFGVSSPAPQPQSVVALQQDEIPLLGGPWTPPVSTTPQSKTFTVPPGSPAFQSALLAFYGGAEPATIQAAGATTGILYLPPKVFQGNRRFAFDWSAALDPAGLVVTVTYLGTGLSAGTVAVIGQVHPVTTTNVVGAGHAEGPTNYAALNTPGTLIPVAVLPAVSVIRVWTAWVTILTAGNSETVTIQAGSILVVTGYCSANGQVFAKVQFEKGVPLQPGSGANFTLAGTGSVFAGGIAWSVDS